ncbi:MAG: hypothetical protein AVDCRST_MAG15-2422, partial [uncultured Rubellimicrobium sp.]
DDSPTLPRCRRSEPSRRAGRGAAGRAHPARLDADRCGGRGIAARRHDLRRRGEHLALPRSGGWHGAALQDRRRRAGAHLPGRGLCGAQGRVAVLDPHAGDDRHRARGLRPLRGRAAGRSRLQPPGRAGAVPVPERPGYPLPHPRHAAALDDGAEVLLGVPAAHQRPRHRSLRAGAGGHAGRGGV